MPMNEPDRVPFFIPLIIKDLAGDVLSYVYLLGFSTSDDFLIQRLICIFVGFRLKEICVALDYEEGLVSDTGAL